MRRAVDLFAGAGGATQGLRDAGFDVSVAVEFDKTAASTWTSNHPGTMIVQDIRQVSAHDIMVAGGFDVGELDLLKACPPCQGFSTLRRNPSAEDQRNDLVLDTLRLVRGLMPRAVLLENVPGLRRDSRFELLKSGMIELGYSLRDYVVNAEALGVPQRRKRLVLVALRTRAAAFPDAIGDSIPPERRRPRMTAGEMLALVPTLGTGSMVDERRMPSGVVARRIAAIPVGGTRFDLPVDLQLECHKRLVDHLGEQRRTATGSYGRVRATEPAPTMTTRCTTPACGSFVHPTEHRAITLREAAAFQTFPADYKWHGGRGSVERQIGNAVPVWMAEALGHAVAGLLETTTLSSIEARVD